MVVEEHTRL